MELREDHAIDDAIFRFLLEHLESMREVTPPESVHALDIEGLRAPELRVWSAWEASELLGCGALKTFAPRSGEIKSMRTAEAHRGRGIAAAILQGIVAGAKRRGCTRLYLETGAGAVFLPARRLYGRHGFEPCGPFGDYRDDPNSVFMTRAL